MGADVWFRALSSAVPSPLFLAPLPSCSFFVLELTVIAGDSVERVSADAKHRLSRRFAFFRTLDALAPTCGRLFRVCSGLRSYFHRGGGAAESASFACRCHFVSETTWRTTHALPLLAAVRPELAEFATIATLRHPQVQLRTFFPLEGCRLRPTLAHIGQNQTTPGQTRRFFDIG